MDTTRSWKRYVLPVVLLVAVVGGLAWLSQYMPTWRTPRSGGDGPVPEAGSVSVCRFVSQRALWDPDPKEKEYVLEIEKGDQGHFDFLFENPSDQDGEIGLIEANCACTAILVGLPSASAWDSLADRRNKDTAAQLAADQEPKWVRLARDTVELERIAAGDTPGKLAFDLPAHCKGVVRVRWDGRGNPGELVSLASRLWVQPKGQPKGRQPRDLFVAVRIVGPIQYFPPRVSLGAIAQADRASGEFFVWSATRTGAKVSFPDEPPLFQVKSRALDDREKGDLQARLRNDGIFTRIKEAWAVTATVHEEVEAEGKVHRHDLGPFVRALAIALDNSRLDYAQPLITGVVRSHIEVGNAKEEGKVDLGIFDPAREASKKVNLWCDPDIKLVKESHDPSYLDVNLKLASKEGKRSMWTLEVRVPRDSLSGPFPEKSAVYLRIDGPMPRLIRIPVIGTARGKA